MNSLTIAFILILLIIIENVTEYFLKKYLNSVSIHFPDRLLRLKLISYLKTWGIILRNNQLSNVSKLFICLYLLYYIITVLLTLILVFLLALHLYTVIK